MLKRINSRTIMIILVLVSVSLPIAFEGYSTPSFRGAFDISTSNASASGEVLKSSLINYVKINSLGEFILKGKETRDDICDGLGTVSSIPIEITGLCDFTPEQDSFIAKPVTINQL